MSNVNITTALDSKTVISRPVDTVVSALTNEAYCECYELIPNDGWIRPYFDIDIKADESQKHMGVAFDDAFEKRYEQIDQIKTELSKTFGEEAEWAISEASQQGVKVSFHLTIWNQKTTMADMYNASRLFKYPLDKKVYHSKNATNPRKYRTIYSKTSKGVRQLLPVTEHDELTRHFVTVFDENAPAFVSKPANKATSLIKMEVKKPDGVGIGQRLKQTDDRNEWFKIGVSLYAIYGETGGRDEFLAYSTRHHTHDQSIFDDTWRSIISKRYRNGGWGCLKKYLDESLWGDYMSQTPPVTKNDAQIAEWVLNNFTKYTMVYDGKDWYRFNRHCWKQCLEEEITQDLWKFVSQAYEGLVTMCPNSDAEQKQVCVKAYNRSGSLSFMNTLTKTVRYMVVDGDFTNRLNQDRYLLGFTNGVLDLRNKTFRDGRPEDYISITTGYHFQPAYDEEKMEYLRNILQQICSEDEEQFGCLLRVFARAMAGDNSVTQQRFYCMYGRGGNGKSVLEGLLCATFGQYFTIMPTSLLTQTEQRSDGANADVSALCGRRFVVMNETQEGVRINTQTLKKHTGDDRITYRNLFDRTIRSTNITWTEFLLTNDKAKLNSDDKGTMRRFVYLHLKAKFQDEEPTSQDDTIKVYKRDQTLLTRLHEYRYEFLHLLMEHLDVHAPVTLSSEIQRETETLIKSQDMLLDMLTQSFEHTVDTADGLHYGLSWQDMKRTLEAQHGATFREIKSKNTDADLFDRVKSRLVYAKPQGSACGRAQPYYDYNKGKTQSRRLFINIKVTEHDDPF